MIVSLTERARRAKSLADLETVNREAASAHNMRDKTRRRFTRVHNKRKQELSNE